MSAPRDEMELKEEAIRALQDFEIVCAMRERTPFSREVLSALPTLKLLTRTQIGRAHV